MAIEIFNRQELKFIVSADAVKAVTPVLLEHMRFDKHSPDGQSYKIYNLYIDTADHHLIRHSLDKPVYKEKLRIRSYHRFDSDQPVFLEVKKRYKHTTNKRRTKIPFGEALELIQTGKAPRSHDYMNHQVMRELETICSGQSYQPKVFITYDRHAYVAAEPTDDLRITFDSDLVAQRYGQDEVTPLLPDHSYVMEIKTRRGMPLWLVQLLREHEIQRGRFSKYGSEYHHYLRTTRKGLSYV